MPRQVLLTAIGAACAFGATALCTLACSGGFATRNICLPNADPRCRPDTGNFTLPDRTGPNPNFPDPNAFSNPVRQRLDQMPSKSGLVINEVMINPTADNAGRQWVELYNTNAEPMKLAGFRIVTEGGEYAFAADATVEAGGYAVIFLGADTGEAGEGVSIFAPELAGLDAVAGGLAIVGDDGVMSDFVQWGEAGSWLEASAVTEHQWAAGSFCVAPVEGFSLALRGGGNLATDFTAWYPTPGTANK
jgi:hypothetical protein